MNGTCEKIANFLISLSTTVYVDFKFPLLFDPPEKICVIGKCPKALLLPCVHPTPYTPSKVPTSFNVSLKKFYLQPQFTASNYRAGNATKSNKGHIRLSEIPIYPHSTSGGTTLCRKGDVKGNKKFLNDFSVRSLSFWS